MSFGVAEIFVLCSESKQLTSARLTSTPSLGASLPRPSQMIPGKRVMPFDPRPQTRPLNSQISSTSLLLNYKREVKKARLLLRPPTGQKTVSIPPATCRAFTRVSLHSFDLEYRPSIIFERNPSNSFRCVCLIRDRYTQHNPSSLGPN